MFWFKLCKCSEGVWLQNSVTRYTAQQEQIVMIIKLRECFVSFVIQTYLHDMAYKNGYRTYESCSFAVNTTGASLEGVNDFSCSLYFQQEDQPEHFIYVNPGISLTRQQVKDTLFSCWRERLKVLPNFLNGNHMCACTHTRMRAAHLAFQEWFLAISCRKTLAHENTFWWK